MSYTCAGLLYTYVYLPIHIAQMAAVQYLQVWPVGGDLLGQLSVRPSEILALLVRLGLMLRGPVGVVAIGPGHADVLLTSLNVQCPLVHQTCNSALPYSMDFPQSCIPKNA